MIASAYLVVVAGVITALQIAGADHGMAEANGAPRVAGQPWNPAAA